VRKFIRFSTINFVTSVLILSSLHSCVYFNTMYNARRIYSEAEEAREESVRTGVEPSRALKDKYKDVIFKCSKILRDSPESSWVDDAIFLMGKALVRQEEYNKGIRKFQELLTNYPESEYVPTYSTGSPWLILKKASIIRRLSSLTGSLIISLSMR